MPEIYPYNGTTPPNGCLMERGFYDKDNDGIVDEAKIAQNLSPTYLQAQVESIGSSVDEVTVTFPAAFLSTPVITCSILAPNGEDIITAMITSISTTGFTVDLSSTTGSANYSIQWWAVLPT